MILSHILIDLIDAEDPTGGITDGFIGGALIKEPEYMVAKY